MEEEMDAKVLQMWSRKEINSSRFYLTGYEPIFFNRSKDFALESVLASVIPGTRNCLYLTLKEWNTRMKLTTFILRL